MSRREASRPRVLVCDDESAARRAAMRALGSTAYDLVECDHGRAALDALKARDADVLLLDLQMPVMDGRAVLDAVRELASPPAVVVVTADSTLRSAVDAVRAGAQDYLAKPYEIEALRLAVERALEERRLRRENAVLAERVRQLTGPDRLLGESEPMQRLHDVLARVAPSDATVLVTGETGTGKELVARALHEGSERAAGPFVALNCAAIPETLVESELFGHRRGAFTGADRDRAGRFREAHGGTLFLDEIGAVPAAIQAKLLRVLQDGLVEPLGGGDAVQVDVRVVAATHRQLQELVGEGRFRDDLYYRLRVVEVAVPPLRERGDDVLGLARAFLDASGHGDVDIAEDAAVALRAHAWPGNVRELRNALERAAIFCRGEVIRVEDLPPEVSAGLRPGGPATDAASLLRLGPGEDFGTAKQALIERFERTVIVDALRESGGNVSAAARQLGLHRQNLQQKMRALELDPGGFRD